MGTVIAVHGMQLPMDETHGLLGKRSGIKLTKGESEVLLQCTPKLVPLVCGAVWMFVSGHAIGQMSDAGLLRGAASCAASGCHGGPRAGVASITAVRGSEYPLWIESDPHARSWRTLDSAASISIMTKLGILRNGVIIQRAHFENCLACHNTDRHLQSSDPSIADPSMPAIAEGVGCEACHGPSQNWYDSHYQGPSGVARAVEHLGLMDTKPLLERAKMCSQCHVGAKDRDMNHDIIAAGHPALYFDMAVYHEAYPKHWREENSDDSSFRAKLWFAGQVAKVEAELELLETRALRSEPVSTWPEFAQFQCTSCHQTLHGESTWFATTTRTPSAAQPFVNGRASPRMWNLQGWNLLAKTADCTEPAGEQSDSSSLNPWKTLMGMLHDPQADPSEIAAHALALRTEMKRSLRNELRQSVCDWTLSRQSEEAIRGLQLARQSNEWEECALAYVAAWASHPRKDGMPFVSNMNTIRLGLAFPDGSQSPKFPIDSVDAPAGQVARTPSESQWKEAIDRVIEILGGELRESLD